MEFRSRNSSEVSRGTNAGGRNAIYSRRRDDAGRSGGGVVRRLHCPALVGFVTAWVFLLGGTAPAVAADQLLFCNQPERIRASGVYADSLLKAGQTYRIFFHYRNGSSKTGPVVVALHGTAKQSLEVKIQKGIGDPHVSPGHAGRQAMARFLKAAERQYVGPNGVRFPLMVKPQQVASGVLTVRGLTQDARLRIYYTHARATVPGARVVAVEAPRRDFTVTLNPDAKRQYFRIGNPEPGMSKHLNGTYGLVYSFKVNAPPGSKVRVAFSPRGGHAGLVGTVGGILHQTRIVGAAAWSLFSETVVGKDGLVVTTLPFGGVFYPVELAFHLVEQAET